MIDDDRNNENMIRKKIVFADVTQVILEEKNENF